MNDTERGTILVVDDEAGMREFLAYALASEGYTVVTAASGREAMTRFRECIQASEQEGAGIDLTIMDIKMPPPGGIEVLRQLREMDPDAVVVMITGYASLDTAMQAVRYGAYDYLTKPLDDIGELLSVVQRGLDRRRLLVNNRKLLTQLRLAYEDNLRLLEEVRVMNQDLGVRVEERTRELERANRRLQELDRLKSELLANVSHELYTPLNGIVGFSQVLLEGIGGQLTSEQVRMVENIQSSGERLKGSFDDLISMAQLSANEVVIHPEVVVLAPMLEGMKSLVEQSAQERKVALEMQIAPEVDTVWADGAKLKRIVYELLSNAIRFTPEGGRVALQARLYPSEEPQEIRLSVSDTGIGIPTEELEQIFDPFQQVDTSLSRVSGGLGLGLSIVRHYAELHGGRVWADSEPGSGSTFTLTLPLMPAPADVG